MTATILITGFGPFPGAPFNPSEPLALELARRRHPAFAGVRRVAHVFRVTYEAVDTELPALIAREKPAALVMFGLAARTKHVRIETRARNVVTRILPDADGQIRTAANIAPGAPVALSLRAPAHRLLLAALASGVPAALSHDAGRYICNYLCWRAAETAGAGTLRVAAFIHVPKVRRAQVQRPRAALTLDDLARAGEAIVRTALAAARPFGADKPPIP
ncbi:MAG: pyroglutamyl-peptidase I [Alphaproteobacteria bacterium]|jgi:pyroglutamyl-peptidase|nr:MAG: pyroglutamyl-peptidase I [Alphaproteobacteria bacterium]